MLPRALTADGSSQSLAAIDLPNFNSKQLIPPALGESAAHLRDLLKQRTEAAHCALEATAVMREVATGIPSDELYAAYLLAHWQIHVGLEAQLAQRFNEPWVQGRLSKSHWLQADLAALQRTPGPAPSPAHLIQSDAEAWGAMYVLEGATLGLGVVTRRLPESHPARCGAGRFMAAYGAQTGSRWSEFLRALAEVGRADWPVVCASARATFELFERVFGAVSR